MSNLQFVILTIEEANEIGLPNIETKRKSVDGTKLITHYEDLVEIYRERHIMTLEFDEFGNDVEVMPELPYPVKSGDELTDMLNGKEWTQTETN